MNPIGSHIDSSVPMLWYMVAALYEEGRDIESQRLDYSPYWGYWAPFYTEREEGKIACVLTSWWKEAMYIDRLTNGKGINAHTKV
jgi:hypothetical protein